MKLKYSFVLSMLFILGACATQGVEDSVTATPEYERVTNPYFAEISLAQNKQDKDRLAILAMRGDYRVSFDFQETVRLESDYERHEDKSTGAYETVVVIEDEPDKIVLQHLLVIPGGHVIKHWRQDWHFEATERFEFVSDQVWAVKALNKEKTAGGWTQCVFEVSDAPRYCGTGKWNHRYGVSTWTSDRTWRPLPRREYTKREDYNAINAENRHTVTPHGWTHEQDNTKTRREGEHTAETLTREFGFNDYQSIEGYDFSPAIEYWQKTSAYWAHVRDAWSERMDGGSMLRLLTEVDGMAIITETFAQADRADTLTDAQQTEAIRELLDKWSESGTYVSHR